MCTIVYYGVRATWKNKIANKEEMCFFIILLNITHAFTSKNNYVYNMYNILKFCFIKYS